MVLLKADLLVLSKIRIQEAQILYDNQCYSGAYYLAGYSVELSLKAKISEQFFKDSIPDKKLVNDIHTHKLMDLLRFARIKEKFDDECKHNIGLKLNWDIITKWSEITRYQTFDKIQASALINAIDNHEDGFNQWLMSI